MVVTRQLPILVAQLFAGSTPGLQRPGKLLAELLLLLPEACNHLLQVYRNKPLVNKTNHAATYSYSEYATDLSFADTGQPNAG